MYQFNLPPGYYQARPVWGQTFDIAKGNQNYGFNYNPPRSTQPPSSWGQSMAKHSYGPVPFRHAVPVRTPASWSSTQRPPAMPPQINPTQNSSPHWSPRPCQPAMASNIPFMPVIVPMQPIATPYDENTSPYYPPSSATASYAASTISISSTSTNASNKFTPKRSRAKCKKNKTPKRKPLAEKNQNVKKKQLQTKLKKPKIAIKKAVKANQNSTGSSLYHFHHLHKYITEQHLKYTDVVKTTRQLVKCGDKSTTEYTMKYRRGIIAKTQQTGDQMSNTTASFMAKNVCAKKLLRYAKATNRVDLWSKLENMCGN